MILKPSRRKRIAYIASFKIAISYFWLFLLKKIFGNNFHKKRIDKLHLKNATILKKSFLELNGLFIKVGQLLSIMSNVLPKEYAELLESLQDNTPSSSFEIVKTKLEESYQKPLDKIFKSFDSEPIASASIGQVHKAVLQSGEIVVVKIQHPYIQQLAKIDLGIIEKLLNLLNRFFTINGLEHIFEQVKEMIYAELDYRKEASSMLQISENIQDISGVVIPKVYKEFITEKILVTDFYEAIKITNTEKLKEWNIDRTELCKKLIYFFSEMILAQGVYHADPHPGNVLVNKEGEIVLIDFGAVGKLADDMPNKIALLAQAIVTKDQEEVLKAIKAMGFIAQGKNAEITALKVIDALSKFLEEGIDVNNLSFEDIKDTSIDELRKELSIKELTATVQVPKDFILLERTMILLHGITLTIAPEYNPLETVKPYLKKMLIKNVGLKNIVTDIIKKQVGDIISLPNKANTFLTKANKGELNFELVNFDKNTKKIYAVIQQLFFVLIAISSFVLAFFSKVNNFENYENIFFKAGVVSIAVLLYSIWKNRK